MNPKKKHLVNIFYQTEFGDFHFVGLVNEKKENGRAVVYPSGIFKEVFGFSLPHNSIIKII